MSSGAATPEVVRGFRDNKASVGRHEKMLVSVTQSCGLGLVSPCTLSNNFRAPRAAFTTSDETQTLWGQAQLSDVFCYLFYNEYPNSLHWQKGKLRWQISQPLALALSEIPFRHPQAEHRIPLTAKIAMKKTKKEKGIHWEQRTRRNCEETVPSYVRDFTSHSELLFHERLVPFQRDETKSEGASARYR